jgi:hypothetical protein
MFILHFLKTDPKARYQGFLFYFKEGFCWTNVLNPHAKDIKCKLKGKTINDVGSMSLYSLFEYIENYYLICLLNSKILFNYYRNFINNTVNIQINDIRQIPIIIPEKKDLLVLSKLFNSAKILKIKQFNNEFSESEIIDLFEPIQKNLNQIVENLYMN